LDIAWSSTGTFGDEYLKFGYVLPHYPIESIFENAILAEKIGFDSIWMTDHMLGVGIKSWHSLEAWSVLSGLSLKTKEITLGTCVSDPHRRHPAVLAQMATTLDVMSGGRAVLGIGAGEAMNLNPYGISWSKPVSRMRDAIVVIKKLWTEKSVDYSGEFFDLQEAFLSPEPIQKPHPPIWVAANSPRTMRITAEMANGWIPTAVLMPPDIYKENLHKIRNWAKEAGRDPSEIEPSIFLFTVAAEDEETAREFAEFPAKILLAFTPRLLKDYGVELPSNELHISRFVFNPKTVQRLLEEIKEIPYKPLEDIFVFGTPDDCIRKLEKYVKAGTRHFVLNFFVPRKLLQSTIRFYVDNVISYFRSEMWEHS
jgi:alkanesulfonate monooxygenase SsuD/methylene tetrahydromethanopterin reductase-like flavin-dependent oxidoreductase (luciferase family)